MMAKGPTCRAASPPRLAPRAASSRLAADDAARTQGAVAARPTRETTAAGTDRPGHGWEPRVRREEGSGRAMADGELSQQVARSTQVVSRRSLLCGACGAAGMSYGGGGPPIECASAYTIKRVEPDEAKIYAEAQRGRGPLRVLWVGAGDMKGVSKRLFRAGAEVVALDLSKPDATDLSAATTYASAHGYQLQFEQGDATNLKFAEGSFDVVVCSMFLCQDFDPAVVVSEIRRVLKPGGRFGFFEHVEDINKVVVDKVFGERSVVNVQYYPEMTNVMAGVVRKV